MNITKTTSNRGVAETKHSEGKFHEEWE